jgi:peroxidase
MILGPKVQVPIRKRFEDFSSDQKTVKKLKELYSSPDKVDLVVGVQLDEEYFPGTTVPKSALITSLFSLFGMGNSDRFSVGFAMMRCFLIDKPWDCHPSNALEELLWAPVESREYPDFRMLDSFWLTELDVQAHGTNLLWRLVTENTNIQCLQKNPLFPYDPETNPILCQLPKEQWQYILWTALVSGGQIFLVLVKQEKWNIVGTIFAVIGVILSRIFHKKSKLPILTGYWIVGITFQFQKDSLQVLETGLKKFGHKVFGLKLANHTNYVVTKTEDLESIPKDKYEVKFSLHEFLRDIHLDIITLKENFDSDLHTKFIRTWLLDAENLKKLAPIIDYSAQDYLKLYPLASGKGETKLSGLNTYFTNYITYVVSRCVVGPEGFNNADLLKLFINFNDQAMQAIRLASLLPSFLKFWPQSLINKQFKAVRKLLIVMIRRRRTKLDIEDPRECDFMKLAIPFVDDDQRIADLIMIVVWSGLTNLQSTLSSTAWDIINVPGLQATLDPRNRADPNNLIVLERQEAWQTLRSAMFESIRLCGPVTGPARVVTEDYTLPSEPGMIIPKRQVITLSSYYAHRQESTWGKSAKNYDSKRFIKEDPPIGSSRYVSWGLKTPHICPGRWFAWEMIQILTLELFRRYSIVGNQVVKDEDKYKYSGGNVVWKDIPVTVTAL